MDNQMEWSCSVVSYRIACPMLVGEVWTAKRSGQVQWCHVVLLVLC